VGADDGSTEDKDEIGLISDKGAGEEHESIKGLTTTTIGDGGGGDKVGGEEHTTTQAPVGIKTAVEKKAEEDDPSDNHGDNKNGLIFRPSCSDNCITTQNKKCGHNTTVTVSLNKVGDFVAFPALWIHRGYYRIQSEGTVIFQA
jgi:hypothetical protein